MIYQSMIFFSYVVEIGFQVPPHKNENTIHLSCPSTFVFKWITSTRDDCNHTLF